MDFSNPLWQETADALGMSMEDLLTAVSFETGGTMDPMQTGPTTKWGQHQGLIQFGEPQAEQYGADFSSPEAALSSQLGAEGAVVKYMLDRGFDPSKHDFMNFYSTINAGSPDRLNASDTAAGGTAGTVRDKVLYQMGDHRANASKWMGGSPIRANNDGSISRGYTRNAGVKDAARANNPVVKEEGLGYVEMPFGIGSKAQAGLAEKMGGGKRMAGMGMGLMNFGSNMINGGSW